MAVANVEVSDFSTTWPMDAVSSIELERAHLVIAAFYFLNGRVSPGRDLAGSIRSSVLPSEQQCRSSSDVSVQSGIQQHWQYVR